MELWPTQQKFLQTIATESNVAFAASRGVGKTYIAALGMNVKAAAREAVYTIIARRKRSLTGNFALNMIQSGKDIGIPVKRGYYANEPCMWVNNSPVCFLSSFNATSIAGLRGDSIAGAIVEEATLQTEDTFHAVESTLRDGDDPFLWLLYNRVGPTSWVKRLIEDKEEDELGQVHQFTVLSARTEENKRLPKSYIDRLRALPGHYRARDYENKWAAASGLVYPIFTECSCKYDNKKPYILAYDPAPVNTQAALCIQRQRDHYCIVDEIYTRRGATLRSGRDALEQIKARWGNPEFAVIDSAAYDHIHEAIHFMNWDVYTPTDKTHANTIPVLRLLLEQGQLRINPATTPNTTAEFYSVVYDEKTEKIAGDQEDHGSDAARYVAEYLPPDYPPMPKLAIAKMTDYWDMAYREGR